MGEDHHRRRSRAEHRRARTDVQHARTRAKRRASNGTTRQDRTPTLAEVKDSNNTAKDVATDLTTDKTAYPARSRNSGNQRSACTNCGRARQDIASYDAARNSKLADLDNELKQIKDASTRRHMERLRTRAQHQTTEALQNAQAALASLESVLAQGTDLQHAAKCVQIADELQLQGQTLPTKCSEPKNTWRPTAAEQQPSRTTHNHHNDNRLTARPDQPRAGACCGAGTSFSDQEVLVLTRFSFYIDKNSSLRTDLPSLVNEVKHRATRPGATLSP